MLIESTTEFDGLEEAEDGLAGLNSVPGFILGYVRSPRTTQERHEVVTICARKEGSSPVAHQREVEQLALHEAQLIHKFLRVP